MGIIKIGSEGVSEMGPSDLHESLEDLKKKLVICINVLVLRSKRLVGPPSSPRPGVGTGPNQGTIGFDA